MTPAGDLPLTREITFRPPEELFLSWAGEPHVAFLDSAADDPRSRYSYLGVDPFSFVEAHGTRVSIDGHVHVGDPFEVLRDRLSLWSMPSGSGPVPFKGGAIGVLGYELGDHLEQLPRRHSRDAALPDLWFGFYDVVFAFDVHARRCWVLSSGFPERHDAARRIRAEQRIEQVLTRTACQAPSAMSQPRPTWHPDLKKPGYVAGVRGVLDLIRAGDIFQANFTMRYAAPRPPGFCPVFEYLRLRHDNPAPFAAYLACGGPTLLSASPERFLSLDADGLVETRPIKGTRPRDPDPDRDVAARAELAASGKDRAENLMIVDLLRNDLGRVAEIGSVVVPSLCQVESFAAVHHLVSVVQARLRPGLGPIDLLRATFPGGSVTGAPKIRAMEIIDQLEASRRGPYCGSIAWIGFDGTMDSSIVIRTLIATDTTLIAQAGGGIVADSDPLSEWNELHVKLRPLLGLKR